MIPNEDIDELITEVTTWIRQAGESLLSFFDPDRAGFARDTVSDEANGQPILGRTSTSRAFIALMELLTFLAEEQRDSRLGADSLYENAAKSVSRIAVQYFTQLPTAPDEVRTSTQNGINMFTDSHVVLATSALHRVGPLVRQDDQPWLTDAQLDEIYESARRISERNVQLIREWNGGRIHPNDQNHDFVTLHAVRSAEAFGTLRDEAPSWSPQLGVRIRNTVLLLMGQHAAGITSQFDPAELAFSVALLHRFGLPDHQPMTQHALRVIDAEQTSDGAWPTSRLVAYGHNYMLFPASFEVALTLTDILASQLDRAVDDGVDLLLGILHRTYRLVTNTYMALGDRSGWSNDRVRSPGRLESWATAIVLSFLTRYRETLLRVRQAQTLARYEVSYPPRLAFAWPDLGPILNLRTRPNPDALKLVSDPTDEGVLQIMLESQFVEPTLNSPVQRPKSVSILMPGPPGTRKTSVVRRLADALGWPLLTLSPPDFLGPGGLEQFEVTAANVFRDLMRLRRVVILFDECEDFFRKREARMHPAAGRTMGAFITAGMLPRLQRLHEARWTIFVLATNAQLEELDPAAIRPGRFDYQQEMRNPPLTAQRRYINARLRHEPEIHALTEALADWAGRTRSAGLDDGEVTFHALDQLIERIRANDLDLDPPALRRAITELTRSGPPPLAQ